jgi:hypothetical protein
MIICLHTIEYRYNGIFVTNQSDIILVNIMTINSLDF